MTMLLEVPPDCDLGEVLTQIEQVDNVTDVSIATKGKKSPGEKTTWSKLTQWMRRKKK